MAFNKKNPKEADRKRVFSFHKLNTITHYNEHNLRRKGVLTWTRITWKMKMDLSW